MIDPVLWCVHVERTLRGRSDEQAPRGRRRYRTRDRTSAAGTAGRLGPPRRRAGARSGSAHSRVPRMSRHRDALGQTVRELLGSLGTVRRIL